MALGLVAAAQTAPLAALPLLLEALDLGANELGLAIGTGLLTTIGLAPLAGRLADGAGHALAARCGLAIICVASGLFCGYTALVAAGAMTTEHAFAVTLAIRIVNGAGVAALHPAAQAWLWAGEAPAAGTRLQGKASAAQNAGRLFGPLAVALISGMGAVGILAVLVATTCLALLFLVVLRGPAAASTATPSPPFEAAYATPPGGPAWPLLLALLALHLLGGGAQYILGPLLLAKLGLEVVQATRWTGGLMTMAATAAIAGNLSSHRFAEQWRPAAGAGLAMIGTLILAPFANLFVVAAGISMLAAGIGIAVPSAMAALMQGAPASSRGRIASRTAAIQATAYAAAAPMCGILVAGAPSLAAASLILPAVAALLLLIAARRREAGQGP
ncbi:MFS transporter [Dankookia rubra]|uniref:MFS transporter n=1 Tax=Dankookia rubra TaxID=1442381 RepID=UPI0014093483|nr:MFS transporter [Dankookia rubra]